MANQTSTPWTALTPALTQDSPPPTQMLGGETTAQPAAPGDPAAAPAGGSGAAPGGSNFFFLMLLMLGGMILLTTLSGRKEKKKRAQMLDALGKRDKIRTAGGIIGTVIEIKKDEVLVETDRASNTRLWLSRGSISAVISSAGAPASADEKPQTEPAA